MNEFFIFFCFQVLWAKIICTSFKQTTGNVNIYSLSIDIYYNVP
jgi:hypothetical protein